ncbi:RecT-like ssDNA binding protein [Mycobacterium phage Gancho]|uniref:RecT-like ssDNA binding protein n=1 Tax=Mycobacterium phage Gancho TaxID=2301613 RepID=A0A385UJN7_9CAUD|nr:RecT-like ssDNA binding protein [Mycobacterium phage Gancho]
MTTNDIAPFDGDTDEDTDPRDEGTLEVFPPARPVEMAAIGTLREHVSAMREAVFFAEGMCYTEMVPQRFRGKPKDAAAAILFGAEVGLSPIASLRSIIVIHGQPGFEARTMKAILKAKGYRFRTIERSATRAELWAWEPDSPVIIDDDRTSPHYGQRIAPDEVGVWTIDDAIQAGFVPKLKANAKSATDFETNQNGKLKGNVKYIETPKVMLEAKVTAEVCRALAPHLLLGLPYAAEEMSEFNDAAEAAWRGDDDAAAAPRRARGTAGLKERAKSRRTKPEPKPEPHDAEEVPLPEDPAPEPAPAPDPAPEAAPADEAQAEPAPAPEATPEPAVHMVDFPEQPGIDPEPAPEPAPEPEADPTPEPEADPEPAEDPAPAADGDDLDMTPAVRAKGENMLSGLLINGNVEDEDRLAVVSEVLATMPGATYRRIGDVAELRNAELKAVVDTLRGWKTKDKLAEWLGEAANKASLREAGLAE